MHTLYWPASSSDLNVIENVWNMLSQKVYVVNKTFPNKKDLFKKIQKKFYLLDKEIIKDMVLKWNDRLVRVLENCNDVI